MSWFKRVLEWFVRDSVERRRFIDEFNVNAKDCFTNLSVDSLLEAFTCRGDDDPSYRHEFSAPTFASGIEIQVRGGVEIPIDDIIMIGKIILCDESIARRMYILHWDTLVVRDVRTGRSVNWPIRQFVHMGGLLESIRKNINQISQD